MFSKEASKKEKAVSLTKKSGQDNAVNRVPGKENIKKTGIKAPTSKVNLAFQV